jgi:hypothetical protein
MAIGCYFISDIGGYSWLFMVIRGYSIRGYAINGYWWQFY